MTKKLEEMDNEEFFTGMSDEELLLKLQHVPLSLLNLSVTICKKT